MTDRHPDVERLADLDAGIADDAALRAHADTCAECREILDGLAAVRAELAALPEPTMPDDVARRIDAALAAAAPTAATTVVPIDSASRRRPWYASANAAGVAAGIVVLLLGVGIGVSQFADGGSDSGAGDTPLESAQQPGAASVLPDVTTSGRHYTDKNLVAALPNLLADEALPTSNLAGGATDSDTGATSGGTTGSAAGSTKEQPSAATVPDQQLRSGGYVAALTTDPSRLRTCLRNLDVGGTPLAVDVGTYAGKPAIVYVFPADVEGKVDVYIARLSCPTGDFDYFARLPAPS